MPPSCRLVRTSYVPGEGQINVALNIDDRLQHAGAVSCSLAAAQGLARPFRMQLIDYKGLSMAMSEIVRTLSRMRIMLGKAAMLVFKDFWIACGSPARSLPRSGSRCRSNL